MCTNQREIVNKYTGHKLFVKCGRCPSCLQEKAAHRVSRIKAQDSPLTDTIMCTLTYRRNDCPYVFREDAYKFANGEFRDYIYYSNIDEYKEGKPCVHCEIVDLPLNVYRDNNYRKIRLSADYHIGYKNIGAKCLCQIEPIYTTKFKYINGRIEKTKVIKNVSFKYNKDLSHCHGKIGVAYYPDVQDFIERLRINLKRNYGFTENFKVYCCSEFGSRSLRPHFHLLFWIPKGTFEAFRAAINASWPFSDISHFDRAVEKAFRASSYVATYVNMPSDFPEFLKVYFKPKHSYSKDFGVNLDCFSLDSLLKKYYRGTLSYFKQITCEGIPKITECPIPKYIVYRYFPIFKGYNRLAPSSTCDIMQRIGELSFDERKIPLISNKSDWRVSLSDRQYFDRLTFPVCYSDEDLYKINVRLNNAYKRFLENSPQVVGFSFADYCRLHLSMWSCFKSTLLRLHLSNDDIPLNEKYDNLEEIKCVYDEKVKNGVSAFLPIGFSRDMLVVTDPNMFTSVQFTSRRFADSYHDNIKHRNVSNLIMSSLNEEF